MANFLAIDLGAESGRAILGTLTGGQLRLQEVHRFSNTPVALPTGLYWNTLGLFSEMVHALAICGRERFELDGIGIDTWGVDFGLLGADGALVDNPRHYRDPRNHGIVEKTTAALGREEIFRQTGIQFMPINSLCQLHAMKLAGSPALDSARTLLFMPDLFNFWLTGVARSELTIASTSQFYNPLAKDWAWPLIARLGVRETILPELIAPGEQWGEIRPDLGEACGLSSHVPVYATASHDTAAAVAAVPAEGDGWAYISSGTWSLMGVETNDPVINEGSLALNFTNEIGAGGKVRLLKNIAGLWLVQECRRAWAAEGQDYSYEQLAQLAAESEPSDTFIEPDAFLDPGRMPSRIAGYCRETGQSVPEQPGQMVRVVLQSLARSYRTVARNLEELTGKPIHTIHIVGGGSRNEFLNQMAADITGRTIVAGPAEATAAGNILVQAIGAGQVKDLAEARSVMRRSSSLREYRPRSSGASS